MRKGRKRKKHIYQNLLYHSTCSHFVVYLPRDAYCKSSAHPDAGVVSVFVSFSWSAGVVIPVAIPFMSGSCEFFSSSPKQQNKHPKGHQGSGQQSYEKEHQYSLSLKASLPYQKQKQWVNDVQRQHVDTAKL